VDKLHATAAKATGKQRIIDRVVIYPTETAVSGFSVQVVLRLYYFRRIN